MDFDMSEIYGVFFEECAEGLDIMETGLLNLDLGAADMEVINNIFRAAHSIKGGAATLGFTDVGEFTHGVETLLDEMRAGKRDVTKDAVELLLASVDCIREMLTAAKDDAEVDQVKRQALQERIDAFLNNEKILPNVFIFEPKEEEPEQQVETVAIWKIDFKPKKTFLQSGGDPLSLFSELQRLGELTIESNVEWLPSFGSMDPQLCYLSWVLTLKGNVNKQSISDVFSPVQDLCDLEIIAEGEDTAVAVDDASDGLVFVDALAGAAGGIDQNKKVAEQKIQPQDEPQAIKKQVVAEVIEKKPVEAKKNKASNPAVESIRVGTDKIDQIINLVGELVITQSMLSRFHDGISAGQLDIFQRGLGQLIRNTRELQESVMQIRMLPVGMSFSRFPRLVHDICQQLGKKVELRLSGENTELDKTVLEKISDPLVHLVRNSLDHGLEMPEERLKKGKPETGILELNAYHAGGNIVLEVKDDGAGLNKKRILEKAIKQGLIGEHDELSDDQINNMIFQAGFSTAESVSGLSGRGVGMDVVKRNINDLGGHVSMHSEENKGCLLTIRLPLTLAILDGQLLRVGPQCYIIPLVAIVESVQMQASRISAMAGKSTLYKLREEYIPVIRLHDVFNVEPETKDYANGLLVVVEVGDQRAGIMVDELLEQQQVVIKSLEANYKQIIGVSGATILGDGSVALILDMPSLVQEFQQSKRRNAIRAVA